MEVSESGKEVFARKSDVEEFYVTRAEGSFLYDDQGQRYIDFAMGWCVGNLGWNNPEAMHAIQNYQGPSYVSPHFNYRPWIELSTLLAEIAPGDLKKCFRATGGTEAVEIALQGAMEFTGRDKFIAIEGAYHGNSLACRGLTNGDTLKPPLNLAAADKLEELLKSKKIAALIMEPVICNLKVHIPEREFLERARELCDEYGTLLIFDEVATGFGRTGKMFASEHFHIAPDIMCLAKGISGGAAAMGATIMREEIGDALEESGNLPYSTYGWHPLSVEASLATIRYMQTHWQELEENIKSLSEYFRQRLSEMKFKKKPQIHVMGLAIALEFEDEDYAQEISDKAKRAGLVLTGAIYMFPALNLEFATAKEGLDILESVLAL